MVALAVDPDLVRNTIHFLGFARILISIRRPSGLFVGMLQPGGRQLVFSVVMPLCPQSYPCPPPQIHTQCPFLLRLDSEGKVVSKRPLDIGQHILTPHKKRSIQHHLTSHSHGPPPLESLDVNTTRIASALLYFPAKILTGPIQSHQ